MMREPMKVMVEIEVQKIADEIISQLTEDGTLVEVVRCRDCQHWHGKSENDATEECDGEMGNIRTTPDFFCAYGERKDTYE